MNDLSLFPSKLLITPKQVKKSFRKIIQSSSGKVNFTEEYKDGNNSRDDNDLMDIINKKIDNQVKEYNKSFYVKKQNDFNDDFSDIKIVRQDEINSIDKTCGVDDMIGSFFCQVEPFNHDVTEIKKYNNKIISTFDKKKSNRNINDLSENDFNDWVNEANDLTKSNTTSNNNSNINVLNESSNSILDKTKSRVESELSYRKQKEIEFERLKLETIKSEKSNRSLSNIFSFTNSPTNNDATNLRVTQYNSNRNIQTNVNANNIDNKNVIIPLTDKQYNEILSKTITFEKYLLLTGFICIMHSKSNNSNDNTTKNKLIRLKYDKYNHNLYIDVKSNNQIKRLNINILNEVISITNDISNSIRYCTNINTNDKNNFIIVLLNNKKEINLEFPSDKLTKYIIENLINLIKIKKIENFIEPKILLSDRSTCLSINQSPNIQKFLDKYPSYRLVNQMKSDSMVSSSKLTINDSLLYNNIVPIKDSVNIYIRWYAWIKAINHNDDSTNKSIYKLFIISSNDLLFEFSLQSFKKDDSIINTLEILKNGLWNEIILTNKEYSLDNKYHRKEIFKISYTKNNNNKFCLELKLSNKSNKSLILLCDSHEHREEIKENLQIFL